MFETLSTELELFAVLGDEVQAIQTPEKTAILADLHSGVPLGVYTATRTYEHNKFLHLEEHLARIERSMAKLEWDYQLDRRALRHALHRISTSYRQPDARVRIDVLAEGESQFIPGSRLLISLLPFSPIPDRIYQNGVQVGIEPALSRNQPEVKRAEFAVIRRKYLESDPPRYECLLTDVNGHILEGTTSNFYGVLSGVLWTAGSGVLGGVARMIILRLARHSRIPVRLEALSVADLSNLSESALSSTSRGLVPIVQIEGQVVGDGHPGPVTKKLIDAYHDYVLHEIRTAV